MTTASYVHLRQWGSCVVVGQRVERGDIIGRSGNTGYSVTSHLHIAVFAAPGEIGSGDFGPSTNNSMQFIFADVEENGVPRIGRWYFSSNQVGLDHCLP
ncbi:MAG: peptidoglycan DD-metalloendopeptidase family protein [Phycisphaerales bacterium]|nr:peptidoglycan DD-metalloendopeptidase family protein [Phycisphaerales bacterium]